MQGIYKNKVSICENACYFLSFIHKPIKFNERFSFTCKTNNEIVQLHVAYSS